jgi:D-alanine-D-alanine ligase
VKIAVVFDTPYEGWSHEDHWFRLEEEIAVWQHEEPEMEYQVGDALRHLGHEVYLIGVHDDVQFLVDELSRFGPDLVFNAVEQFHGRASLDYVLPSVLDAEGYRYTGSPPLALLVTRNKAMSKEVLAYHGIMVPGFVTYRLREQVTEQPNLRFPLIVKPLETDASAGIAHASVVQDVGALAERVAFIHDRFSQPAIAEEFVEGRELYAGVIGHGSELEMLPLTELVFDKEKSPPEERIATQYAKWDEAYRARRGIRNVFARRLANSVQQRIEEICQTAFRALWLRDYGRLDVRVASDGEIWFIEANANPFISYGHDMANAAQKSGMDYYQFVQRIVDKATERYEQAD